jgi:hypothetical protein
MKALHRLRSGASALSYWWLEGEEPVSQDLAQARANICKTCPKNQDPSLFEALTGTAAVAVKKALELKHERRLSVEGENLLNVCEACGCDLKLKVFVPMKVVLRTGLPDYFTDLVPNCWLLSESKP